MNSNILKDLKHDHIVRYHDRVSSGTTSALSHINVEASMSTGRMGFCTSSWRCVIQSKPSISLLIHLKFCGGGDLSGAIKQMRRQKLAPLFSLYTAFADRFPLANTYLKTRSGHILPKFSSPYIIVIFPIPKLLPTLPTPLLHDLPNKFFTETSNQKTFS